MGSPKYAGGPSGSLDFGCVSANMIQATGSASVVGEVMMVDISVYTSDGSYTTMIDQTAAGAAIAGIFGSCRQIVADDARADFVFEGVTTALAGTGDVTDATVLCGEGTANAVIDTADNNKAIALAQADTSAGSVGAVYMSGIHGLGHDET